MGGRGSSSATAGRRVAASSVGDFMTGAVSDMSEQQLTSAISSIEKEMEGVQETMLRTQSGHTGYLQGTPWGSESEHREYEAALSEHQRLRRRRDELADELARRRRSPQASGDRTFVNSYGEATTREITSSTYEQARRRTNRAVLRNLGY